MTYRIFGSLAALALSLTLVAARPTTARAGLGGVPVYEAATLCQYLQQHGYFDGGYLQGFTVDHCVAYFNAPDNEQARSLLLGLCGLDVVREDFGVASQDACVSTFIMPG
jgi:hypothetical protein